MPDEIDRLQEWFEEFREDAIARARRGPRVGVPRIVGGRRLCIDCECEIPGARQRVVPDCVRCVQCEAVAEANCYSE